MIIFLQFSSSAPRWRVKGLQAMTVESYSEQANLKSVQYLDCSPLTGSN